MNILKYFDEELPKCTRTNTEDEGTLIGLPFPYTVPTASEMFQEMYYWDTYFTNHGLILRGDVEQAKNNVENMFYLIERYGFMPNGNRTYYLNNSQPPFLSLMVRDVYEVTQDKEWISKAVKVLEKEYWFWQTKRGTVTGLNRYDGNMLPDRTNDQYADILTERIGYRPEGDRHSLVRGMYAICESGWDMNCRMSYKAYEYNPVDLNSLLFALEQNVAFFYQELEEKEVSMTWEKAAEHRAELCRKYLLDKNTNLYFDYNYENQERGTLFSVASLLPLFVGMANEEEAKAAERALIRLETDYGILVCEKNDIPGNYQWNYPNGWAPHQYLTFFALDRYGYHEHARTVAKKFAGLVEKCFEETNHLWEKYNVINGTTETVDEYGLPPMLGWTFGVYITFKTILEDAE